MVLFWISEFGSRLQKLTLDVTEIRAQAFGFRQLLCGNYFDYLFKMRLTITILFEPSISGLIDQIIKTRGTKKQLDSDQQKKIILRSIMSYRMFLFSNQGISVSDSVGLPPQCVTSLDWSI